MLDDWTAEAVARMHVSRITGRALAAECGYTEAYLSTVLNGKKGTEQTKQNVLDALARLEAAKKTPVSGEAQI